MRWPGLLSAALVMSLTSEAGAQIPTAVAEERIDVNGDGRLDVIRIEEPAALSILITGQRAANVWKPFTTAGRRLISGQLTIGSGKRYGGRTVVVAVATFGKKRARPESHTHEALVVAWERGRKPASAGHPHLVEIWRGGVGPRGRDREWSLHVEATPSGLLRFQRRPGVTRCDEAPAYLFPEAYDWKRKRFRRIKNLIRVGDPTIRLTATRTPPGDAAQGSRPAVFRARAASAQAGAGNAGELMVPREIDDGDPATVWREPLGGDGTGEFFTVRASMPDAKVRALRILPGDASSPDAFRKANRLKSIALLLGGGRNYWIDFPTDPAGDPDSLTSGYWVELPEPVETSCATVVIGGTYRARGGANETAIAEIGIFTPAELSGGGPLAIWAKQVADGGARAGAAGRALLSSGPAAAAVVIAVADQRAGDAAALLRLRRLLAELRQPAAAAHLAAALAAPDLPVGDRKLFTDSLIGLRTASVAPMRALLADDTASARARNSAIAVLAGIDHSDAFDALVAAAGVGSRTSRRRVSIALGAHRAATLQPLIEAAAAARTTRAVGREADLWRAVGLLGKGSAVPNEPRASAGAALASRLADATEYELRYRLFQAAAAIDDGAALAALRTALSRTGGDAEAIALRRIAASALTRNPSPEARAILVGLIGDPDPGVRKRVALAIGQRDDGEPASDRALASLLAKDTWSMVRKATAGALATRCAGSKPAASALFAAVDDDSDIDVRIAALSALTTCAARGLGDKLIALVDDKKAAINLRTRAATLLGALGERRLCARVVDLFQRRRREIWSSEDALRLASATAGSLGALRCEGGVAPLVSAAKDEAFPELQAAALMGLGQICPRDPKVRRLFRKLASSSQAVVSVAARSARSGCSRKRTR